ncbi:hypothetical protein TNCV_3072791 [Trichonephila clavipes]|nr:hypothetical protein TNCV_3072791 [Trichonephila clavipes]
MGEGELTGLNRPCMQVVIPGFVQSFSSHFKGLLFSPLVNDGPKKADDPFPFPLLKGLGERKTKFQFIPAGQISLYYSYSQCRRRPSSFLPFHSNLGPPFFQRSSPVTKGRVHNTPFVPSHWQAAKVFLGLTSPIRA